MLTRHKNLALSILGLAALIVYLSLALSGTNEQVLMPGKTTHGHYQIELACAACHTKGMGVKQDACNNCHEEELKRVDDSHPVIKFKDPRNASRLEKLDARYCITCHREHQPELTANMGLTLPDDYCYHCHQNIAEERPTHKDLPYDSCATAGCHNFHDNTGLYERFLVDHLDEPAFKQPAVQRERSYYPSQREADTPSLGKEDADMPDEVVYTHRILYDWSSTVHAQANVNCSDCHLEDANDPQSWVNHPTHESCQQCHAYEVKGWLESRHGMRLAQGMDPMTPGEARLPMQAKAAHAELSCVSCHGSHRFNTEYAAVEACLNCHSDEHSLAYKNSLHYQHWHEARTGLRAQNEGVSCATCHMPRIEQDHFGVVSVRVDHNQNNHLRPNDKMIRSSCIQCHGLQFTLNALADEDLIQNNFVGHPDIFVESLEMAREEMERNESRRSE